MGLKDEWKDDWVDLLISGGFALFLLTVVAILVKLVVCLPCGS